MLINVANYEFRKRLKRNWDKLLKAHHEQRWHNLIHRNDTVGILAAAEASVIGHNQRNFFGQAANDSVHALVRRDQLVAAEAFKQAVNEHECAEVRAHPAILPEALEAGDRSGCDHHCHGSEVFQPCAVVDHGVLNAAPLTPFCNAGLVVVTVSLAAYAVLGLPYGIKAFKLFINSCYYFIEHHYLPP
ncbi:unknown [Firmicutes bacterium CAG:240]|nr:unknown [Firmicutes bacterium CAG:240]